jgi:hypothetical protein
MAHNSSKWKSAKIVGYVFALRFGEKDDDYDLVRDKGYFPGDIRTAISEILQKVPLIVEGAPMPQQLKHKGVWGLSEEMYQNAANQLRLYWSTPELKPHYKKQFGDLFEREIWPTLNKPDNDQSKDVARNRLVKQLRATFRAMDGK